MDRALARLAVGARVRVRSTQPQMDVDLAAWARSQGHQANGAVVTKGPASTQRWNHAERAGAPGPGQVVDRPPLSWGLAARGAMVEAGGPDLSSVDLVERSSVWNELATKLYAQAAAGQWDPATAVDWSLPTRLDPGVEGAVVQTMTYLVENEQTALMVPARFLGRIHPHFREVVQFLATQVADEARHMEVFTRRGLLVTGELGRSGAGGRASLATLLEEPDFTLAAFLLSVLGEGTFLSLLAFIERHAPDPVTARVAHLALQDEARHVAFGQAHMEHQVAGDPGLRDRLKTVIRRRHQVLASTSGLSPEVFDALVVLAAGSWSPAAVARGWDRVQILQAEMDQGRRRRLARLGFGPADAAELSSLHTRNFM